MFADLAHAGVVAVVVVPFPTGTVSSCVFYTAKIVHLGDSPTSITRFSVFFRAKMVKMWNFVYLCEN